jgi:hypothetical protein
MAQASVEIPAELVAPVRESVVLLYEATAEALHFALRAHGERRGPLAEVHRQRGRLAELDALLARLAWSPESGAEASAGGVELRAPRGLLQDVLYGALIDSGERLAVACGGSWRAEAGLESVHAAASEVIALDRLLGQVRKPGCA